MQARPQEDTGDEVDIMVDTTIVTVIVDPPTVTIVTADHQTIIITSTQFFL